MLWTIVQEDIITEGMDKISKAEEYIYHNRRILGYPASDGKVQIVQLITSNPADYMNPEFAPGNLVFAKKL